MIGAKGKSVKAISMAARQRIEGLTGRPCELFLEVRVTPKWTKDPGRSAELGYRSEDPVADSARKAYSPHSEDEPTGSAKDDPT